MSRRVSPNGPGNFDAPRTGAGSIRHNVRKRGHTGQVAARTGHGEAALSTVEQVRGSGARLGWAFGVTVSIVAWGYLVWLAIDFGREARNGDSDAWWMLGLAALGAVACLFVALLMVARVMEGRPAAPDAEEPAAEEPAVVTAEAPAAPEAVEPEPTVPIAVPEPVVVPTPRQAPTPTPAPAPAATVGPVMSTQVTEPVPYVGRRAATPAEEVPTRRQEPYHPVAPAAHHGSSYPGAGKRSAGRHAGPAADRPTVVPPGVAGKRRANV